MQTVPSINALYILINYHGDAFIGLCFIYLVVMGVILMSNPDKGEISGTYRWSQGLDRVYANELKNLRPATCLPSL